MASIQKTGAEMVELLKELQERRQVRIHQEWQQFQINLGMWMREVESKAGKLADVLAHLASVAEFREWLGRQENHRHIYDGGDLIGNGPSKPKFSSRDPFEFEIKIYEQRPQGKFALTDERLARWTNMAENPS
jgi:hypothetical protein